MCRPVPAFVAAVAVATASCVADSQTKTDLSAHQPLAAAIAKVDKVTLYEGLPHPRWDARQLEAELKAKKTFNDHGFPFYADPLTLKPEDAKTLTELAADPKSVQKWAGPKSCGGFHPDYMVEWQVGKDVYRMHVCFGCHEVKLFGPKHELYADMADHGLHGLEKVLKGYQANRPTPTTP